MKRNFLKFIIIGLLFSSCVKDKGENAAQERSPQFQLLSAVDTGIIFSNDLVSTDDFNVYKYRNFYNGGGVAIADINNDGLQDIYLTSNLNSNKLYLNKGNFKFEDVTETAGVSGTRAWSTGVSMVDINADGYMDIYVCNSGDVKGDNKQNEFFINNGDGTFSERAEELGLADKGFSTHASFFDFDHDGDLDVYLLNNSYQAIGSFNLTKNERPKRDVLGGDKLFENRDGSFVDISEQAGIYGSVIGFGLGVTVTDVNNDNWQDIYVSNDFFERDYLYVNQKNGTFKEVLPQSFNSISGASMGADAADINNDGYSDIFVTEMLPSEYDRLKTVTTFEDWNKYQYNVKNDYFHQFTRNMLQLNNTNLTFSEVGRLSGVEASDWSWGALFFDMDNDGLKDLFIANGIYQDLTNQDYLKYISNQEVIASIIKDNQVNYKKLIEIIPSNKVKNHAYRNNGNLEFERIENGLNAESFSNGAAYGDLDNDGDLDLVVNNVNMPLFIYRNNSDDNNYLKVTLNGEGLNRDAIGAKLQLTTDTQVQYLEQQPVRGFQSSMDNRPNFGFKPTKKIALKVVWPSGKITTLDSVEANQNLILNESDASDSVNSLLENDTSESGIFKKVNSFNYIHKENNFVDFNIDRLLPFMRSTEGPKMAVGDVNGDGLQDVFIGGSKGIASELYIQNKDEFVKSVQAAFETDKVIESGESLFFDADNDGDLDLYVCSGGVEYSKFSPNYLDKLYSNDGQGNFTVSQQLLPTQKGYHSTSTIDASDIDGDGDLDLFVGERAIPNAYGNAGSGYLLINDGLGNFMEASEQTAPDFKAMGMIKDADFVDFDNDGDDDLVVIGEFMAVKIFKNSNGSFQQVNSDTITDLTGWWNTIESADIDGDGDMDLVLGNHGLNSRFKASKDNPIKLYANDFDGNSYIDPILAFTDRNGKEFPYALRHNLVDQLKYLSKKYPDYESFKNATIQDIFTKEQLANSTVLEAKVLESVILVNNGNFNFSMTVLPYQVQYAPVYAIKAADFDDDGDKDLLLGGNLYGVMPEFGRYDASYGNYLENDGNGNFTVIDYASGINLQGQVRDIKLVDDKVLITKNNDSLQVFSYGN